MTDAPDVPLPMTGDREADDELALLRRITDSIHTAMDEIAAYSVERQRLVLSLRRRSVRFTDIAAAAKSTPGNVYKVHREARTAELHDAGDHSRCTVSTCDEVADELEEQPA